jgi:excisionase family DNA binding protein
METHESHDDFLTVAEVAALLKLNQQTVRNWIEQGTLPAVRVGRRVRILRSDFERVLAQGYRRAGAAAAVAGPTAEDFWSGDVVAVADPGPGVDAGGPPGSEKARAGTQPASGGP